MPLPPGFTCSVKPNVLNEWERHLFNVLEEYFYSSQKKSNRHSILSQVRLVDVLKVSKTAANKIQINAMSFDFVIVSSDTATPIAIFEADGKYHKDAAQQARDQVKDELVKLAGIPLFRVKVEGDLEHIEVVYAKAAHKDFSPDFVYSYADSSGGPLVPKQFTLEDYPNQFRRIESADIEMLLIKSGWSFLYGWEYATDYELRDF